MRDLFILFIHLITTVARLASPNGVRSVVAESLLVKHQLLILNRSRHRAPNLRLWDRLLAAWCTLFMRPSRLIRSAIVLKPSTLLHLHQILTQRKYHLLFSAKGRCKPGPKGPSQELIDAIVATKQHNPCWGCPRIAQQIALAFGVPVDKDVVRRVLATHYLPKRDARGPSWLTFLGHLKDSLWSPARQSRNQTRRSTTVSGMMFVSERQAEDRHGAFFEAAPRPAQRQHNRV